MAKTIVIGYESKAKLENITGLNEEELMRLTKIFGRYEFIGVTKKFQTPVYVSETREANLLGQPIEANDFICRLEGGLEIGNIWNVAVCYSSNNHHVQI